MKKKYIIIALILVLAVTGGIAAAVTYHQPISIKTPLTAGEVSYKVELSDGELWFKTQEEVTAQLTAEDFIFATKGDYYVPSEDGRAIPYYELNGGKKYSEQELLEMMNIYPEHWYWRNGELPKGRFWCYYPCFAENDRDKVLYAERGGICGSVCAFKYSGLDEASVFAAPTPVKWSMDGYMKADSYYDGGSLFGMDVYFGEMDSRIGDIDLAIRYSGNAYNAFFVIEQTAYQVIGSSDEITQEDFIKLLISICEAPHPEKENMIDLVLEQ